VKIWGMSPSLMNQLSTLGLVFNLVPHNTITIAAGEADASGNPTNMATVFTGTIWSAYGDYQAMPDVPFVFVCLNGAADQAISVAPSSFPGSTSVATMMSGFARQMNLGFENNGISITLTNQYFTGSAKVQADKCAEAANISWGVIGNTLAIWPKGGNRATTSVPVISPETGMISYPAFTQQGIIVKTLFNPAIAFGGLVQVKSTLLSALAAAKSGSGSPIAANSFPSQWAVNKLDLALDSLLPKGQWMSTVYAYNPGYARVIFPPA
jgi:Baseplate hub gp41